MHSLLPVDLVFDLVEWAVEMSEARMPVGRALR